MGNIENHYSTDRSLDAHAQQPLHIDNTIFELVQR